MTQPMLTETAVRDLIRQELPDLLREDRESRDSVTELGRERFADRDRIEGRIERMLDELRKDREENTRKWEEHVRENQRESERIHEEIMAVVDKVERKISALGARWELNSERSFRDALAAILEKSFGVAAINVNEFDDEGTVFGRPDQVELDVVIHNGTLILIEIKSSVSKADMHIFGRKVRFYERRHERKAQRLIVISPVIDPRAREIGKGLGIELYADSVEVPVQ